MSEKIELIISEYDFEIEENGSIKNPFVDELKNDLKEISEDIDVKLDDIGQGYNWPVILIFVGQILILGKEINEVIDGWQGLAQKFVKVFIFFKNKHGEVLISHDAAKLVALDYIFSTETDIERIDEMEGNTINLYGKEGSRNSELASRPINIYTFYFALNNKLLYVIGIKSNGKIEFINKLDVERYWV
jgi:hypothetical protein